MGSRQHQASIEQCHKFSLTTQTEHEQISTKKEKPLVDVAITIDKLLSEYPASDSFERKSSDGLNIRAIQKSIFGQSNAQCVIYPQLTTTDSGQFQLNDSGVLKELNTTKRFPFKASNAVNGSSSPSIINSIDSLTDEMSKINEKNVFDYDMDSFNESTSAEILSSLSPSSRNSSRRLTNSTKIKSMSFEMGSHASSDSSSSDLSRVSTPLSVKQFVQTKQHVSRSAIQENEFESTNTSEISSETLSSTTRTSKSRKSYNYEAKKHGRRKKSEFSEENQKHRDNEDIFNIRFNKLNSGSIQKALSKSSYSTDSQSSQESNVLCRRSHQTKNRPANIECHVDDFEKSEQSDILSLAEFDSNYSRKIKLDGKRYIKNVAVQTIHLEPDNDLLPMFTPLLLKDIAENMKGMSRREGISSIIQTHVELIKRQAQREKRMLEEWDSAINDLEERCQLVSLERLKLLLHSNDFSYAF